VTLPSIPPLGSPQPMVAGSGVTVYLGGHTARGADGELHGSTLVEQFGPALTNLLAALRRVNGQPQDLVSVEMLVTDASRCRAAAGELAGVWRQHLGGHAPAVALMEVAGLLDPDALVELVGVAVVRGTSVRSFRDGQGWEERAGYSRAVRVGARILVSGTTAGDSAGPLDGDTYGQTREALRRGVAAVQALGGRPEDVVRTRLLLAPGADWCQAAKAHAELVGVSGPANTTLYVGGLIGEGLLVEVELEAEVGR
jgi:enamine deaminase RidA (YjgF/YER057c/UK114 family)